MDPSVLVSSQNLRFEMSKNSDQHSFDSSSKEINDEDGYDGDISSEYTLDPMGTTIMRPETLMSLALLRCSSSEKSEMFADGESTCSSSKLGDLSVLEGIPVPNDESITAERFRSLPRSENYHLKKQETRKIYDDESTVEEEAGEVQDFTEMDKDAALAEYRQLYFSLDPVVAALEIFVDGPLPGFYYEDVLYTFADSTEGACLQCSNTATLRYSNFPSSEEYDQILAVYGLLRRINGFSHDSRIQSWWKSIGRWMEAEPASSDIDDVDEYNPLGFGFLSRYNSDDVEDYMDGRRMKEMGTPEDRLSPMMFYETNVHMGALSQ